MVKRDLCLTGPDGSGKTTITTILSYRHNYALFWMRGSHIFLSKLLSILKKCFVQAYNTKNNDRLTLHLPHRLMRVWSILELLSYLLSFAIRYVPLKIFCRRVIMDRCPLDLAIWIHKLYRSPSRCLYIITYAITHSLFQPILITASKEVLRARKPDEFDEFSLAIFNVLRMVMPTISNDEQSISMIVNRIEKDYLR